MSVFKSIRRNWKGLTASLALVVFSGGLLVSGGGDSVAAGPFVEPFTTTQAFYDRFDHGWSGEVQAGALNNDAANDWMGDHDMSCGNPASTSRTIHVSPPANEVGAPAGSVKNVESVFYPCLPNNDPALGHVMTSVNTEGYVTAWFAPKQTFTDVTRVCWDQNETWLGGGKWIIVNFLTPAEYGKLQNGQMDLGYTSPDFPPANGPSSPQGDAANGVKVFAGGMDSYTDRVFHGGPSGIGSQENPVTDKAGRYQHCVVDNGNGTLTLSMGQPNGSTLTSTVPGSIPNGPIKVEFADDNYNPDKHFHNPQTDVPRDSSGLYTWHWDNIFVETATDGPTTTPSPTTAPPVTTTSTTVRPTTTTTSPSTTTIRPTTTTTPATSTTIAGQICTVSPGVVRCPAGYTGTINVGNQQIYPSQTTTTTTIPTTAPQTTTATTTTTVPVTTTTVPSGTAFSEAFSGAFNPARFTPAYWRDEEAGQIDPTINGSKVLNENGQLRIESGEQNYGDTAVRVNQPFDFAGRTGTINFDVNLAAKDGWTRFTLSQDPYAVTSYGDDNAAGQGPDRGFDLQFHTFAGCSNVELRTYTNRVETDHDGPQYPQPCVTGSATDLSHVTVTVSNDTVTVKSGATTLGTWSGLNLGFNRGYLYLDAHNHATIKYAGVPTWVTHWDNLTFDGPVLPALNVAAAQTIQGTTVSGVPSNLANPRLIFNAQHGQQDHNVTLTYRINGNSVHSVPLQRLDGLIGVYMLSLPINATELVQGNNTVSFTWSGTTGTPPKVADLQIVWD